MKTKTVLCAAVLVLAALAAPSSAAPPPSETKGYFGSAGSLDPWEYLILCNPLLPQTGFGGVCFRLPGGAVPDRLFIDDDVLAHPGGLVSFFDASRELLKYQHHFCSDTVNLTPPKDAAIVLVQFFDVTHHGDPFCTATTGTVTLTFR